VLLVSDKKTCPFAAVVARVLKQKNVPLLWLVHLISRKKKLWLIVAVGAPAFRKIRDLFLYFILLLPF
jgi:hypothetical protein